MTCVAAACLKCNGSDSSYAVQITVATHPATHKMRCFCNESQPQTHKLRFVNVINT